MCMAMKTSRNCNKRAQPHQVHTNSEQDIHTDATDWTTWRCARARTMHAHRPTLKNEMVRHKIVFFMRSLLCAELQRGAFVRLIQLRAHWLHPMFTLGDARVKSNPLVAGDNTMQPINLIRLPEWPKWPKPSVRCIYFRHPSTIGHNFEPIKSTKRNVCHLYSGDSLLLVFRAFQLLKNTQVLVKWLQLT